MLKRYQGNDMVNLTQDHVFVHVNYTGKGVDRENLIFVF